MAISTYAELLTAVADHMRRSNLGNRPAEWIAMGEADINRELRVLDMVATQTGALDTSSRTMTLPDRYLERVTFRLDSPVRNLTYVDPDKIDSYFADGPNVSGEPGYYTITSEIEFNRVPDSAYPYTLTFYRGYQLTEDDDTNHVLTNYAQLYLYSSLVHGAIWARNTQLRDEMIALRDTEIAKAKKAEARRNGSAGAVLTTELTRCERFNIDRG